MPMIKKAMAALLALCLMLCGTLGALAEEEQVDVMADLINYFLGNPAQNAEAPGEGAPETEQSGAQLPVNQLPAEEAPVEEAPVEEAPVEAAQTEGEEEEIYVYDEEEEEEIVVDDPVEVTDYAITEGLPEEWTNILLLGTDSRGSTKYLRTDTMIVLSINKQTTEAKMTSVLRDTWIEIPGYDGQRLNAACVYGGPELSMRMINQYFGLNIRYYALVNMKCLVELVDSLGGVTLDVSKAEAGAINRLISSDAETTDGNKSFVTTKVHAGEQVLLNGKQTLYYTRIRKLDTDYARTERQRTVLTAIARQLQGVNVFTLASLVTSMLQYVETNLTFEEIMNIASVCMKLDLDNLTQFRVPADGTFEGGMFGGRWCIMADFDANKALLHQFIYGE